MCDDHKCCQPRPVTCAKCKGTGNYLAQTCSVCGGVGQVIPRQAK
jgi:DnaJ-class molecular chaperone